MQRTRGIRMPHDADIRRWSWDGRTWTPYGKSGTTLRPGGWIGGIGPQAGLGAGFLRATIFLVAIWIVFALLYTQVGFARPIVDPQGQTDVGREPLRGRAFVYSFEVMSLQKPEPRPLTTVAHILV